MSSYFTGSFLCPTTTGNSSVTGVGFTPSVVIFWGIGKADAQGGAANVQWFFGAATSSTARWCVTDFLTDNASSPAGQHDNVSNKCITCKNNSSTIFEADMVSLDSDGFTLNWTTAPAAARRIFYVAIGGISAKCGTYTQAGSTTGNNAVTGVGFQPSSILFSSSRTSVQGTTGWFDLSFTLGTTLDAVHNWWLSTFMVQATNPTNEHCIFATNHTVGRWGNAAVSSEANLSSFDSDGFTLNFTNMTSATAYTGNYIAMAGVSPVMNELTTGTGSAGDTISVTGLGFYPGLILFATPGTTAGTDYTQQIDNAVCFGAATDTTHRRAAGIHGANNLVTSQEHSYSDEASVSFAFNANSTSLISTIDLQSLNSDGFNLTHTLSDNVSRRIFWVAFPGVNPVSGGNLPLMGVG